MKIVVFSNNANPDIFIENLSNKNYETLKISGNTHFESQDLANSIVIIDIDSMRDQGFTIASKIAGKTPGKKVVVAVSTLEVDSRDSKFDLFFNSFTEVFTKLKEIIRKYDEILQSD